MKLNRSKCEYLSVGYTRDVKFATRESVPRTDDVKYERAGEKLNNMRETSTAVIVLRFHRAHLIVLQRL